MKKAILFLFNLVVISAFAQAPQAIKYQAIARNSTGNILLNQDISMRISILSDSTGGNSLYTETHALTTNAYGLVNLEIGHGTGVSGNFTGIDWSKGSYFVKVEADENAGSNFSLLGVSQLLSVPYALYANSAGMPHLTDEQRDSITNPSNGMVIYNVTTNCINIWRTDNWFQVCGDCVPQPTAPFAGTDMIVCSDTITQLSANTPIKGIGTWSILSGTGGSFSDIHAPNSNFTGHINQQYTLSWQIATSCASISDQVQITFTHLNPANAGTDQYIYDDFFTFLAANEPGIGNNGQWTNVIGNGYIWNPTDPNMYFQGNTGESYTFRWTTWNDCDTSYDDVVIAFCPTLTVATAGQDITIPAGTSCILQGSTPGEYNTGLWTVVSGSGGSFADPSLNNTTFNGLPLSSYTLRWTITSVCDTSFDEVNVNTGYMVTCGESITYGGQVYHTVLIGNQCWIKENLNIGTMINGISDQADNGTIEKYCYNDDPANCSIYGGLYQWNEMMQYNTAQGTQGICASGWHIPTDVEWCTMTTYLDPTVNCIDYSYSGINAGGKMKETGFTHWNSPNTGATNESGFTALGSGYRSGVGGFGHLADYAYFWSSSENSSTDGVRRSLDFNYASIGRLILNKTRGYSVRCVKD